MDIFTVSLFGHRNIMDVKYAEKALTDFAVNLIKEKDYVEFLIGRNGEFDILAASVIRRVRKEYGDHNSDLTLILPYKTAEYRNNEKQFCDYYGYVEIFEAKHFKSAIIERNRSIIDRSDLVAFYLEQETGGAYLAYTYAKSQGKQVTML